MPWQPKSTAPLSFDLASAFTALITGDATWGWLLAWVPLLGDIRFVTADFCANGPSQTGALEPEDFLTGSRNPIGQLINNVTLAVKLRNAAYDRVFAAYCELPPASADDCVLVGHGTYVGPTNVGQTAAFTNGPVPAGTTKFRVTNVTVNNVNPLFVELYCFTAAGGYLGQIVPNDVSTHQGGTTDVNNPYPTCRLLTCNVEPSTTGGNAAWDVMACSVAFPTDYTPQPQPQPAGVLAPTTKVYTTIADLGAELDALELKSDVALQHLQYLAQFQSPPSTSSDAPIEVAADAPVDLAGAVGFIVTVASIPAEADELFGTPVRYHRIGRVTVGTDLGWYPSIDLVHSPLLVSPLPPGATKCQVNVYPPATATVTVLRPPK